jgi:hypothetical protein
MVLDVKNTEKEAKIKAQKVADVEFPTKNGEWEANSVHFTKIIGEEVKPIPRNVLTFTSQ